MESPSIRRVTREIKRKNKFSCAVYQFGLMIVLFSCAIVFVCMCKLVGISHQKKKECGPGFLIQEVERSRKGKRLTAPSVDEEQNSRNDKKKAL